MPGLAGGLFGTGLTGSGSMVSSVQSESHTFTQTSKQGHKNLSLSLSFSPPALKTVAHVGKVLGELWV